MHMQSENGNEKIDYQIHNNICTKHVGQCVVTFLGDWMRLLAKIRKAIFSGHSFSAYRKLRVHGTHAIASRKNGKTRICIYNLIGMIHTDATGICL